MEAPLPMDNKPKTLPSYPGIMAPINHRHPPPPPPPPHTLHGPAPPGPQRIPPPHDGQPHGLPTPIPHSSAYEHHWRQQPYPPPHYESAVQRRHSNPITNPPPPQQQQPPPPPGPPHSSHPPYPPQHPSAQQQNREIPQLPPGDPYHRPNSLPGSAPTHPVSEVHSPRHYGPMNGAQSEPTPHSAPPPSDYRPSRMPYTAPGEPPAPGVTNGEHAGPPPGYMPNVSPHHVPGPSSSAYEAGPYYPYPRQRKAARAQQACDQCRARKAKCDEGRPACSHCKENGITCNYKDLPPQKQEKTTQIIIDRMKEMFDAMMDKIEQSEESIHKLYKHLDSIGVNVPTPPTRLAQEDSMITSPPEDSNKSPRVSSKPEARHKASHREPLPPSKADLKPPITIPEEFLERNKIMAQATDQITKQQHSGHSLEPTSLINEADDDLSIPLEHTTAAHKLLDWPSIHRLLDSDVRADYVQTNERKRGLIRLYGCGEGRDHDTEYYYQKHRAVPGSTASPATTSSSPQFEDEYAQANSPSWGYGLPVPPHSRSGESVGGLDPSGYLNTQPDTVKRLHRSYMNNMHILHPFLDATALEWKIDRFIRQYGYPRKSVSATHPGESRGMKRKRSAEAMHYGAHDMSRSPSYSSERWVYPQRIERSIDNAIILMVLALGAICEHKGPLPGFAPDPNEKHRDKQPFAASPEAQAVLNDILSPSSGSASGMGSRSFQSPNVPSPDPTWDWKTPNHRPNSRVGTDNLSEASHPRNVDVIPGLAYYAYAAGILGEQQGGNELPYVQAAILASLYAGQLAHPFQSHGWIFQAARACQFLLRSREYDSMPEGSIKELLEICYWTCLQHESDLLAELDVPHSGISRSEARIKLPKGVYTLKLTEEPVTMMMFFYSAQIHLRKVLNRVHTDLYKADKSKEKIKLDYDPLEEDEPAEKEELETPQPNFPYRVLTVLGMNLEDWKVSLPPGMQWTEMDPPSDDINTARLRAKYYGARYIIYRPILHYALHHIAHEKRSAEKAETDFKPSGSSFKTQEHQATNMARWNSKSGLDQQIEDDSDIYPTVKFESLPIDLQRACNHCIEAAIRSTKAFHNIKGRPIVTNIFGTAHAQFGNMLVLSATYMSGLRQLVRRDELDYLLQRTIRFLAMSKDISPTLMVDAQILSGIYAKIFKKSPNSSFTTDSLGNT